MERGIVNLKSLLAVLPSVRRFLQTTERALRGGHNVWVLLPRGVDPFYFADLFLSYLEGPGRMSVDIVDLTTVGESEPFDVLREIVGRWQDVTTCRFLEDLAGSPVPLPEVLLLKPREETPALDSAWLVAIERWVVACRHHAPDQRRKLCIVALADALLQVPKSEVTVTVQKWWGIPSALEAQLACRLVAFGEEEGPVSLWREYLIPSLAGNDLMLGEYLWDVVIKSEDEILSALIDYAMRRGWRRKDAEEVVREWRPLRPGGGEGQFSRQMYSFWARGWIVYTLEYGGEIHSALLALLEDEKGREIAHRLWRAQTSLLLPAIDNVRINLCEQLTRFYGQVWTSWADKQENSLYPELGLIEAALRKGPIPEQERHRWLRIVQIARAIRNKLAHYSPISFQEFAEFWERVTPLLGYG